MARFDLSKYATVAERLETLKNDFPDYRIETWDYSTPDDRAKGIWRVKASLYLSKDDQAEGLAKATGHAFEVDGQAGANVTSALENCESSAIGRALAIAGWSVNKDNPTSLASREEMEKVARGPALKAVVEVPDTFVARVDACVVVEQLHSLWDEAVQAGFSDRVKKMIADKKAGMTNG